MSKESIEKNLCDRFAAPLKDYYKRRIIFWQDPDGEFAEMVDELSIPNVKTLKLTGKNNFSAKLLLSETDTESNYLVYNPISYPDIRDNWLLDIEMYSEEFRADLLSMRMTELNIAPTAQLRKAMKMYSKFFDNKERVSKLKSFKTTYTSVGQLHIDVLAVLCSANFNTTQSVIGAILMNGLDKNENQALETVKKFGNESVLWELVNRFTGFVWTEDSSLYQLAAHILMTALSVTMDVSKLKAFEKYISEPHQQLCYSFVNEWMHSSNDNDLYEIAVRVEKMLRLPERFDKLDVADLLNSECFPCINESILRHFMTEISDNIIKAEDISSAVEKRRTLKWYKRVRYYYDGLLQVAKMQQFYQQIIKGNPDKPNEPTGFHIAEHTKLWKAYIDDYYKMDTYYRLFHAAFGKSLKLSSTELEDLYKNVADYVEGLYKNWYLQALGGQWTKLTEEDFRKSAMLPGIPQQEDFYPRQVKNAGANGKVFVIISDALRYEVAKELCDQLTVTTKGNATLTAVQSTFPSATKFGMAALLPHNSITLTDDITVLCDGMSTEGTASREKILQSANAGNVAITYSDFIKMKMTDRRERTSGASVVYIYHNSIDAVGDKANTEDQVFEACETAIDEIKNLVRIITNELSGSSILITADHGFLYSYKPLDETDKAEKSYVNGTILELDRRYIIANSGDTAEHMIKIPLTHMNSDFVGFAPLDNIRMKKTGGGMNYVHGGVSLQELVVPVIVFKNLKSSSKKFVDVKKAEIQLISQSRKVSNSIFSLDFYQKTPVGGKTQAAIYELYMTDSKGGIISDKKTIIADKTDENGADRMFRVRFTLKSVEFKKTDVYYLTVVEKETGNITDRIEFMIDIAFINDFDF